MAQAPFWAWQASEMKPGQLGRCNMFMHTEIEVVTTRAVCHHPEGTKSDSPGWMIPRYCVALLNRGYFSRSGWSRSSTCARISLFGMGIKERGVPRAEKHELLVPIDLGDHGVGIVGIEMHQRKFTSHAADQQLEIAIRPAKALGHQRAGIPARETVSILRREIRQELWHVLVNNDFVQIGTGLLWVESRTPSITSPNGRLTPYVTSTCLEPSFSLKNCGVQL